MSGPLYFRFLLENSRCGTAVHDNNGLFLWMDSAFLIESEPKPHFVGTLSSDTGSVAEGINQFSSSPMGGLLLSHSRVKEIEQSTRQPGEYNARVWRQWSGPSAESYGSSFTDCSVAFDNLEIDLESIFRTVEPDQGRNDDVYGHKFRELLILACTEVEALFKGLFDAHGHAADRMTTKDFIKTLPVLQLDRWGISLGRYGDYPQLLPFAGWSPVSPTQSLGWYHAYNQAKHDRRRNFSMATMRHTINAVAAVAVLIAAQFGYGQYRNPFANTDSLFRVFRVTKVPEPRLAEQYIPPSLREGASWTHSPLVF